MDMANLTNKQQGEVLSIKSKTQAFCLQMLLQTMLDNNLMLLVKTSRSILCSIGAVVRDQNLNRVASMRQFNVDRTNAHSKI